MIQPNVAAKGTQIDSAVSKFVSLALLGVLSGIWFVVVNSNVPGPYLDEYFHVRQALEYWRGRWHVWDPKITTPPGLYVVAWVWLFFLQRCKVSYSLITQLRGLNSFLGIPLIWQGLPTVLEGVYTQELGLAAGDVAEEYAAGVWQTTRNLAFLPPLFFLSALFYTDVLSVLVVLRAYAWFHSGTPWMVLPLGAVSLLFRQNNIFWCAVYFAGLEVVRSLDDDGRLAAIRSYSDVPDVLFASWENGTFYNPSVDVAGVEDYILSAVTLAIAAVKNLPRLLPNLFPYVTLLGLFGVFVVINGGVVLGDKSNHVASLHLPQMLYIWVYFAFFSFPVLLLAFISKVATAPNSLSKVMPRPLVLIAAIALSFAAVHFNTIIHPFTLADNRHYTFYVFRILRLYPLLRYAAIPAYVVCGWLCITALGTAAGNSKGLTELSQPAKSTAGTPKKTSKNFGASAVASSEAVGSNRVAFVLVWSVSSALGLITAPLVEPRYFILPYIFWRMHVPPTQLMIPEAKSKEERNTAIQRAVRMAAKNALLVETAWILLVNAATMYIFTYWGFEWPQEPGAVQRFMW